MANVRFRLSTLLFVLTIFAVVSGLGYQIYLLKGQLAKLNGEVSTLKSQARPLTVVYPPAGQSNQDSPFRLIKSAMTVNPGIEDGMKAGEWELKKRLQEHRDRDEIRSPKTPNRGPEQILTPFSQQDN
jgi:hypothetical protein